MTLPSATPPAVARNQPAPAAALTAAPTPRAEHVFVVGVSRSGTTLVKNVLNRSSLVGIATENHFLGHLLPSAGVRHIFRRFGDLRDDANVGRLVEFVYSGGLSRTSRLRGVSRQWRWTIRNVPRAEFERRILESDRSERAVFAILLDVYAEKKGKVIRGEKTPAHVRYVDTLFAWFPGARVVHMVRDPRAIFVSEVRRRRALPETFPYRQLVRVPALFEAYILIQTTLVWAESVWRLRRAGRRHAGRYLSIRFEDLVRRPEVEIRRLCEFLGIPFETAMLDQVVVSQGARLGDAGIDSAAADRWRASIPPLAARWLRVWLGRQMNELGYDA